MSAVDEAEMKEKSESVEASLKDDVKAPEIMCHLEHDLPKTDDKSAGSRQL